LGKIGPSKNTMLEWQESSEQHGQTFLEKVRIMREILFAGLALSALQFIVEPLDAAPAIRTVALEGQQASGTSAGVLYSAFGERPPAINNLGQVAFRGFLAGGGADNTNAIGIWSESSGSLELVARSGSQVPGLSSGATYSDIGYPLISDNGKTAFRGFFQGTGINSGNNTAHLVSDSASAIIVAQEGDLAPGVTPSAEFGLMSRDPLLSIDGALAFSSSSTGGRGIWSDYSGALSNVALVGMQAPSLPPGSSFGSNLVEVDFNSAGQITLTDMIDPRSGPRGVWRASSGNIELVAATGQQAAGMPTGTILSDVNSSSLNSNGQVSYRGRFLDSDADFYNDNGIWLFDNGSTSLLVHSGEQAPSLPLGISLRALTGSLNEQGQMWISSSLAGVGVNVNNDFATWIRDSDGAFQLVAREREQTPGLPSGYLFTEMVPVVSQIFPSMTINTIGQIVFQREYKTSLTGGPAGNGIWAQDIHGNLQLIAATGFDLEIAPGDSRTVSFLRFHGSGNNESGQRSGFNDRGQVAFYAAFTDGSSGIFVSNLVAIPEPSAIILVGIPALGMLLRRR
jgi:hypothetical protein